MTRKQALHKALEVIKDLDDKELKDKLGEILEEMPFNCWSERTIFDTIEQFIIDNGRIPSATDFKKKGLPPHPVIKLRFGINLKEFLEKNYPSEKLCSSKIYSNLTREQWQDLFISEYHINKPETAEQYNRTRRMNSPSWATIAKMFGVTKWNDWLMLCNIAPYRNKRVHTRNKCMEQELEITSTITVFNEEGRSFHVKKDGDKIMIMRCEHE